MYIKKELNQLSVQNGGKQYWDSLSRYLSCRRLIEELAGVLEDSPEEMDCVLGRLEKLKSLNSLHSFLLKTGVNLCNSGSVKFQKGNVADLFCRSIGIQLNKMEFSDIRQCFDNYVR